MVRVRAGAVVRVRARAGVRARVRVRLQGVALHEVVDPRGGYSVDLAEGSPQLLPLQRGPWPEGEQRRAQQSRPHARPGEGGEAGYAQRRVGARDGGEDLREQQQGVGLPRLAAAAEDALYWLDHIGIRVARGEGAELRPLDLVRGDN